MCIPWVSWQPRVPCINYAPPQKKLERKLFFSFSGSGRILLTKSRLCEQWAFFYRIEMMGESIPTHARMGLSHLISVFRTFPSPFSESSWRESGRAQRWEARRSKKNKTTEQPWVLSEAENPLCWATLCCVLCEYLWQRKDGSMSSLSSFALQYTVIAWFTISFRKTHFHVELTTWKLCKSYFHNLKSRISMRRI